MENKSNIDVCQVLENIRCQFDFLFQRGFRIVSVLFVGARNEQWQILLTEGNYLIQLLGHEERVDLALNNLEWCDDVGLFELHDLMGLMEREGTGPPLPEAAPPFALNDLTRMAAFLEKHLDDMLMLIDRIHHVISISKKVRAIDLNNCPDF